MCRIHSIRRAVTLVTLILLFSPGVPAKEADPVEKDFFAGLNFQLVEETKDVDRPIASDHRTQVDFRSTLILRFDPLEEKAERAPDNPAWTGLQAILETVGDIAEEYTALNAASINIDDPNEVEELQQHVKQHGARVVAAVIGTYDHAAKTGRFENSNEFVQLLNGRTTEPGYKPGQQYENLAFFLAQEIERLQASARHLREEKSGYEVTVIAIRHPISAQVQALHVDPYDNLPGGQLSGGPLAEYGIRMTEEELSRFRMEVEMSARAAEAIREIMANGDDIRDEAKALAKRLETRLKTMLDSFALDEGTLKEWRTQLDRMIEEMVRVEATASAQEVKTAASQVAEALRGYRDDLDTAGQIVTTLTDLRDQLTTPGTTDLFEIVAGEHGLFTKLNTLASQVKTLGTASGKWAERAKTIAQKAPLIGQQLINEAVVKEIETFLGKLPKTASALTAVSEYLSTAGKVARAAETLEEAAHEQIYFDINEEAPPSGVITLNHYQLNRGEHITVKVQFRAKDSTDIRKFAHATTYRLEVEKLEQHHSIGASLIFARAQTGTDDATRWKPNVAAMVNWHYRHRDPENGFEEMWNWLNPGAGVHLASLDQGDDTAEFGIGPGFTFWNGLMHAGFGWNLSQPEDREYFFLGVNLFHLLDVARPTAGGATWQAEIDTR